MDTTELKFVFPKAEPYVFLFEHVQLLLLSWNRDNGKHLFIVSGHENNKMVLDYPGELFSARVLEAVERIFFIEVTEEGKAPRKYVLGSFFEFSGRRYGAYYQRGLKTPDVVLFRIEGDGPMHTLEVLDDREFDAVSEAFSLQHRDLVDIQAHL